MKLWKWEIRDAWGQQGSTIVLASGEARLQAACRTTMALLGLRAVKHKEGGMSYQFEMEWCYLVIYPPDDAPYEEWSPGSKLHFAQG